MSQRASLHSHPLGDLVPQAFICPSASWSPPLKSSLERKLPAPHVLGVFPYLRGSPGESLLPLVGGVPTTLPAHGAGDPLPSCVLLRRVISQL